MDLKRSMEVEANLLVREKGARALDFFERTETPIDLSLQTKSSTCW